MLCSSRQTHLFISTLLQFIRMLVVCENINNGDKFHCRKFMQTADEKLIINKLYHTWKFQAKGIRSPLLTIIQGRIMWQAF